MLNVGRLWAIREDHWPRVCDLVLHGRLRAAGFTAAKPYQKGTGASKIAIIPIQGVLTKDGPAWLGNSYESIVDAAEKAAADTSVRRIVLSVDSPGGEVTGLPETAAVLAQVARVKPVSAMVDGMAASAAYWLTSQANHISLTPSGEVGSVGVRMMHEDISKMLEDSGIKITELYSGNFKTEWSPFKPLSEDAIGDMQTRLDEAHTEFLNAIASGRGERVSQDMRANRIGEGRMFGADKAVSHGLVDKIQTGREFYKSITPAEEKPEAPVRVGFPIGQRQQQELVDARLWLERARIAAARRLL
jgi:signal peptide peptidase SppA